MQRFLTGSFRGSMTEIEISSLTPICVFRWYCGSPITTNVAGAHSPQLSLWAKLIRVKTRLKSDSFLRYPGYKRPLLIFIKLIKLFF